MNVAERLIVPKERAADHLPPADRRSPPMAVKVLIPIWGARYTRQFLQFCLPTLLAPGNVPALAQALPCTVVVMTSLREEFLIREHPVWRRLAKICRVEVQLIDDLITDGNHSTTITLAFARAIRETGAQMLDTCFILLVSDYLVADGALASVLTRMQAGASGVLACNFQIVAEDAIPFLSRRTDPTKVEISLSPRELLRWALGHLHSATTANIVNFKLTHNEHANRLFWRVDENTLIGRPYLMHMIGVRPEVTDFMVGSSFDYSFLPEMCPSNNVVVLTDSDDYLVVEMQPRDHEKNDLRLGPFDPKHLASTLAEWTTARHRENVRHTLVYHAADIPKKTAEVAAEADAFIDRVTRSLTSAPQPYRMHPYWIGAIAAHRSASGQVLNSDDLNFLLGQDCTKSSGIIALLWRIRVALFGTTPDVKSCHPRWPDYRLPIQALRRLFAANSRVIVASSTPHIYARWLAQISPNSISIESARLLNLPRVQYMPLVGSFDACLLCLAEGDLKRGNEFLQRVGPLLKQGGQVLVFTTNDRTEDLGGFGPSFAYHAGSFTNLAIWLSSITFVGMSKLRARIQQTMVRLARAVAHHPLIYFPVAALAAGFLAIGSYACNQAAKRTGSKPPRRGFCSSVFMVMRLDERLSLSLPRFELDEIPLQVHSAINNADEALLKQSYASPLEPLVITTTEHTSRLSIVLARYKFVANLLAGRHQVCELGRSDSFGIRLVLPQVKKVAVYDSDETFVAKFRRRNQDVCTLHADVHDVVQEHLPRSHDAIYSFDVLERTGPEYEEDCVRHLRDSLSDNCSIAIIGCSSPDRDVQLSDSTTAPLYTRTGPALRELLQRQFSSVILFSMSDEIIQPGISPNAQYFLALCCSKKT